MQSQFFGLMIGYSGLTAYQAASNTVANNAANVETEGYSKQYVKREAADALRSYTGYGMVGAGVSAQGVAQLRNFYYDLKYWENSADVGRYETQQSHMAQIESFFKEDSLVNGFTSIYTDDFYDGLQELTKDPGSTTTRASFIGNAQSLVEYFNTMSAKLTQVQKGLNSEIKSVAEKINTIAEEIASLNKQINVVEITGCTANELRDRRALLVDDLSKLVDVTVDESPIVNESDNNNPTGMNRYRVSISNGCSLVDGYSYNTLEVRSRSKEEKYHQTDAEGLYDLYWSNTGQEFSVLANNLSGSLKALFELRDGNNNEALSGKFTAFTSPDGQVKDADGNMVDATSATMKVDVKEGETLEDLMARLNIPEKGTLNVSGFHYCYDGWSVEFTEGATSATFKFSDIKYKDGDGNLVRGIQKDVSEGKPTEVGDSVDYQGIPYYQSQMNQWVRQFAYRFNSIEKSGEDLNGDSMADRSFFEWIDAGGKQQGLTELDLTTGVTNTAGVASSGSTSSTIESYYYRLQASNFCVNSDIIYDPSLMSTTSDMAEINESATDIVDRLISLKTNKTEFSFRGCNSTEFLALISTDIAVNSQSAINFTSNSTNIQNIIDQQRQSVSGVDDDEEALDLVKFQNAYNLNAKIIQTMTEIYDRLILQTGV
ncbi:MAG: flagellar hook-associated protein FlgK [Lachnospiraceae bacterium]|nr:flagellar hook-associated protein FlgK [Lachnospiraceae bacterium]